MIGYIERHWRGDLSLATSFWLNGLLGYGVLVAAFLAEFGSLGSVAVGLGLVLFCGFLIWQGVGIWRSAGRTMAQGGSRVWSGLARLVVVGIVLLTVLDLVHLAPTLLRAAARG